MVTAKLSSPATGQRLALRSFERMFTLSDDNIVVVVHVLRVHGQTQELLRYLPAAVVMTFNRHPRMRFKMLKNELHAGEIQPPLTLDDVDREGVLHVTKTNAQGLSDQAYQAFAQKAAHSPYDRYSEFPFKLHVWVDEANDDARLILISDHFISDGNSGNTILNDVLRFAAELSRTKGAVGLDVEEMELIPGIFDIMMEQYKEVSEPIFEAVKNDVRGLLKDGPVFTHSIKPNDLQEDFRLPNPPKNPSTLLFADGKKENLQKILDKCHEERTTFFGALAAAVFTGYIVTSDSVEDEAFKMSAYLNLNMRQRVAKPFDPDMVGAFVALSDLEPSAINVPKQRFWDLARQLKEKTLHAFDSFVPTAIPMSLLDLHFNRESDPKLHEEFPIKCSNLADVDISSVGKYPHVHSHAFADGEMTLESLHYSGRVPFICTASLFYVTSLHNIGYSIGHHYDEATGKKLFDTTVAVMEGSWSIASDDLIGDAVNKLVAP